MKRALFAAFALALSFFGGAHGEAKAQELVPAISLAAPSTALALAAAPAATFAEPAGHSFCPGGMPGGPEELARKMERALAADGQGNQKLEGCYAAPIHFLIAFQNADEEANLTSVSELPAYIRKLVVMNVPGPGEFTTSCLHEAPNGVFGVTMNCLQREPRDGEVIYGNPDTGVRVLWSSCVNPGFGPPMDIVVEGPPCIAVEFPSMGEGVPIRGAYIGPRELPGRCHALLLAGEDERRFDMPEECPNVFRREREGRMVTIVCDWSAIEQNSSRIMRQRVAVQNVSYSFRAREDGTNVWYLPPEALEGLPTICWEMPDGTFRTLSVGRGSFVDGVATITEDHVRQAIWR